MVDIEFIRKKHFVEGWSIRKISLQLQIARQTVRKALASSEPPRYQLTKPRPSPVMDPFVQVISAWLEADQTAPKKQQHTAKRVYDRLVAEHGFTGGESTVRRFVSQLRQRQAEVFIPLAPDLGEQAQVDWGQAVVKVGGTATVVHLFVLRLRASGVTFAWAAPTEKLEAFLEGHVRGFAWLGGVPVECVYDNLKTAVVKILTGPEREEQVVFSSLRAHYLFDSQFCNPASGHEKGSVENGVGYVRRNALVPVPEVADLDELNAHLLQWCEADRQRRRAKWVPEAAALRPLPARPFRPAVTRLVRVNSLSLVNFERNRYSVPGSLVGQQLRLDAHTDRVELWHRQQLVATHRRYYSRGETVLELEHYLLALAKKPRAVNHAAVVRRLPAVYEEARQLLCHRHPQGYRDFAKILMLHLEFPADKIRAALRQALDRGILGSLAVRQLLVGTDMPVQEAAQVPDRLRDIQVAAADLSRYDALLGRGIS